MIASTGAAPIHGPALMRSICWPASSYCRLSDGRLGLICPSQVAVRSSAWDERAHLKAESGEATKGARRDVDTDTRRGAHGRFAQIKNDTKLDAIVVPGNRPHVPARSHTGRTLQGPVRPGSHPNQACVQGPAASGCGLAERGVTTGLAASIGPSGPPEYARSVRQRAVRRPRRAGGAPSGRTASQTLIKH